MKVTLESTSKIVDLVVNGVDVPARIWEGETANGVRCYAYISRIVAESENDCSEFEADLVEVKEPSVEASALDFRLVI